MRLLGLLVLVTASQAEAARRRPTESGLCQAPIVVVGQVVSRDTWELDTHSVRGIARMIKDVVRVDRVLNGGTTGTVTMEYPDGTESPRLSLDATYLLVLGSPAAEGRDYRYVWHRFVEWGTVLPAQDALRTSWERTCAQIPEGTYDNPAWRQFLEGISGTSTGPRSDVECAP